MVTQDVRCKLEDDIKHEQANTPWSSVLVGEKYSDICFMCFGWSSGGSVCMLACKLSLPGESVEVQGLCEQMCFNIALEKKGPQYTLLVYTITH